MSWKSLTDRFKVWHHYRESVRELSRLSDRELNDLGINRSDILHVARNGLRGSEA